MSILCAPGAPGAHVVIREWGRIVRPADPSDNLTGRNVDDYVPLFKPDRKDDYEVAWEIVALTKSFARGERV